MANMTPQQRRRRALDVLTGMDPAGGPAGVVDRLTTDYGALGEYAIDFGIGDIWSRSGLAPRDRSLAVIAILTTLQSDNALRFHLTAGLGHGLKPSEIEEVMVQLGGYAGFPRALDGMRLAREVFTEQGIETDRPSVAQPKDDDQRRADARAIFAMMTSNQSLDGVGVDMGTFTGAAGRFAFGELWAREEISRRDRSLIVISTLAAQSKMEELRFHVRAGMTHGLRVDELEELMVTTAAYVGFPTAVEGFRVLREVLAEGGAS
jgi:4-carboxymuconolactone decarboxylase